MHLGSIGESNGYPVSVFSDASQAGSSMDVHATQAVRLLVGTAFSV
ncbi:hypothetical protein AZE42_06993 [Rhizopogon vesiculosus]|uniref:Uncharacterized protein n=1 Tax=Rhizopogon vesiculosus TaxID=180088 RepID=A0A1J8QYE2_9AGAM|nr:hypothetical protein AZE42_06993 [Rhizopogon vesiculosus]